MDITTNAAMPPPCAKKSAVTGSSRPALQMQLAIDDRNSTRKPLKWKRVLRAFVAGRSFNRFESERELHDHALHSTVSRLQSMGVTILRDDEVVPGFMGAPTHVKRYRLAEASRAKAMELLGGAAPVNT